MNQSGLSNPCLGLISAFVFPRQKAALKALLLRHNFWLHIMLNSGQLLKSFSTPETIFVWEIKTAYPKTTEAIIYCSIWYQTKDFPFLEMLLSLHSNICFQQLLQSIKCAPLMKKASNSRLYNKQPAVFLLLLCLSSLSPMGRTLLLSLSLYLSGKQSECSGVPQTERKEHRKGGKGGGAATHLNQWQGERGPFFKKREVLLIRRQRDGRVNWVKEGKGGKLDRACFWRHSVIFLFLSPPPLLAGQLRASSFLKKKRKTHRKTIWKRYFFPPVRVCPFPAGVSAHLSASATKKI